MGTTIGKRIHIIRKARGISQAALGAAIGESRHIIKNIETGRTVLSFERGIHIVEALHCSAEDLLREPAAPVPPRPRMRGRRSFRRSLPDDQTSEHRGRDRHG